MELVGAPQSPEGYHGQTYLKGQHVPKFLQVGRLPTTMTDSVQRRNIPRSTSTYVVSFDD